MSDQLSARDVLRIPNYRRLWFGQLVSEAGDGLTNLALLLLVNSLTGSTAAIAAMAIVLAVPPLTIGLLAGAYVDRADRRRIMLASDLLRAVTVLGFILVGSADLLWLLFLLAFAQATVGTFFTPARGAILPRIVPPEGLLAANSIAQATRVVSSVLGAGLGGVLIGIVGVYWPAFVIDALTFLISFTFIVRLPASLGRIEAPATGQPTGLAGSLAAGLRTVAHSSRLSTTILALAVCMLGLGAVNVLFVPLLVDDLKVNPTWMAGIELAQTSGMILAAGIVAILARRLAPTTIITLALAGIGICIGFIAGVSAVWQVIVLLFVAGWMVTPLQAMLQTIVQTAATDATRGRVVSLLQASLSTASVASMAVGGVLGDLIGIRAVYLAAAIIVVGAAGIAFLLFRGAGGRPVAATVRADKA
jgi:MFS family permease